MLRRRRLAAAHQAAHRSNEHGSSRGWRARGGDQLWAMRSLAHPASDHLDYLDQGASGWLRYGLHGLRVDQQLLQPALTAEVLILLGP